jgi:hypothetical protein
VQGKIISAKAEPTGIIPSGSSPANAIQVNTVPANTAPVLTVPKGTVPAQIVTKSIDPAKIVPVTNVRSKNRKITGILLIMSLALIATVTGIIMYRRKKSKEKKNPEDFNAAGNKQDLGYFNHKDTVNRRYFNT